MGRPSRGQKLVQDALRDIGGIVRKPRKRRERKTLPPPYRAGMAVKVTSTQQFRGVKLGLISGPCRNDDGIMVYLTNPKSSLVAEYICIQSGRGDTISLLAKDDGQGN